MATERAARPRSEIGSTDAFLARAGALLSENERERVSDTKCLPPKVSDTKTLVTWADVHRSRP